MEMRVQRMSLCLIISNHAEAELAEGSLDARLRARARHMHALQPVIKEQKLEWSADESQCMVSAR